MRQLKYQPLMLQLPAMPRMLHRLFFLSPSRVMLRHRGNDLHFHSHLETCFQKTNFAFAFQRLRQTPWEWKAANAAALQLHQGKRTAENHLEDCHLVAFSIHFAVKSACVFVQLFFFEPRWHLASGDVFVCRSIWASGDNISDGQSGSNSKHGKQVYFNSLGKMKRRLDGVGHLLSINQLPLIIKG